MATTLMRTRDWSSLPELVVFDIAVRLNPIEFAALAGVCKSWRKICTENKTQINFHHPPLLLTLKYPSHQSHALAAPLVVAFSFLDDRLYRKRLSPRLRVDGLIAHFHSFSHGYVLFTTTHADVETSADRWGRMVHLVNPFAEDLVSMPAPTPHDVLNAVLTAPPDATDCVVIALSWNYIMTCRLGIDDGWTVSPSSAVIEDGIYQAIFFKGRIYALTYDRLISVDIEPEIRGSSVELSFIVGDVESGSVFCLVVGDDDLFLIKVHSDRNDGGDDDGYGWEDDDNEMMELVYRLKDREKGTWEYVRELGDRTVFICEKCPGYVSSSARLAALEEECEEAALSSRPTGNVVSGPKESFSPLEELGCAENIFMPKFRYKAWIPPSYFS